MTRPADKADRELSEAEAFDARVRERVAQGMIPDLRLARPCDWFFNNPWRRPEYVDMIFGSYLRFALAHLPPVPARVLEVGCGMGHMALELGREGYDVLGVDLSGASVAIAQEHLERHPIDQGPGRLRYLLADLLTQPIEGRFAAVCCFLTLHHFESPETVLDVILDLLEPGGRIVVVEPARDWFSELDALIGVLIRVLLAQGGRWHEPLRLPESSIELDAMVQSCLAEYREARDAGESLQSPNDNATHASEMLAALRCRFEELAFQPGHALLPRVVGGVRGPAEPDALKLASFLQLFDEYSVRRGLLQPGAFLFAGRRKPS